MALSALITMQQLKREFEYQTNPDTNTPTNNTNSNYIFL